MPPHDLKRYVGKLSPKFHWWCPNASQIYFLNDSLWKMQHKATKIKSDWNLTEYLFRKHFQLFS